jgi:hypothetical protein
MIPWLVERGLCDETEAIAAMGKALARLMQVCPDDVIDDIANGENIASIANSLVTGSSIWASR